MSTTHRWQLLAIAILVAAAIYLLAPILTPFAVGALLAYLSDPLVDRIERLRVSRNVAVSIVFILLALGLLAILLLLLPLIERQISRFIERLPVYLEWGSSTLLPWIEAQTGLELGTFEFSKLVSLLKSHWQEAGGMAAVVLQNLSKSGMTAVLWLTNLLLIPVVTFYLLADWDRLLENVRSLIPRDMEPTVSRLAREADQVLSGFLRGQLGVMLSLGAIYALGLTLIGLELALLIGFMAGVISFVPYLGAIVGFAAGMVAALVQFGDWWHLALVALVFGVGQLAESFLLTPWLVGGRIRLHPVAVIFAVMAGGHLFGFLGVLIALPVAAVVMVLVRYAHQRYTGSSLYAGRRAQGDRD